MKKSDKKIDKALREALTHVCEAALESVDGFVWLTHLVNYTVFPSSLKIICVFETDQALARVFDAKQDDDLRSLINKELSAINIKLHHSVSFDTEEACERSHAGKWNERLRKFTVH